MKIHKSRTISDHGAVDMRKNCSPTFAVMAIAITRDQTHNVDWIATPNSDSVVLDNDVVLIPDTNSLSGWISDLQGNDFELRFWSKVDVTYDGESIGTIRLAVSELGAKLNY